MISISDDIVLCWSALSSEYLYFWILDVKSTKEVVQWLVICQSVMSEVCVAYSAIAETV